MNQFPYIVNDTNGHCYMAEFIAKQPRQEGPQQQIDLGRAVGKDEGYKMKNTVIAVFVACLLSACSAGANGTSDSHTFAISAQGATEQVEGFGATSTDAVYDSLAWMAANTWKAGTPAYRAMSTAQGLSVLVVERPGGKAYRATLRNTAQGLVIDVSQV